jgi:hypothetical protein
MRHADIDFARDTTPGALDVFYDIQRRRSPEAKLQDVFNSMQGAHNNALARMRRLHPQASDREVFLRAVALHLPPDLMVKAYGWDPAAHE